MLTTAWTIDRLSISVVMMMMVLCPKAGSLAFTPPGDEMSEVVSRCLIYRQLWVSYLSKVPTHRAAADNLWAPPPTFVDGAPPGPFLLCTYFVAIFYR